eukprot:883053-Rhodomonas_salina.1
MEAASSETSPEIALLRPKLAATAPKGSKGTAEHTCQRCFHKQQHHQLNEQHSDLHRPAPMRRRYSDSCARARRTSPRTLRASSRKRNLR